jgi:hypothetical protein
MNWKKIAVDVFSNRAGFDGDFLRRWWQCHLNPNFLRGALSEKKNKICLKH